MDNKEAADVVKAMKDALQANPNQFQLHLNITGFSAQNTGGIGYLAQNQGGIGFNSSMTGANVTIAQQQAGAAMDQAYGLLLQRLGTIEAQLRAVAPDKTVVRQQADAIRAEAWVPAVITAALAAVLKAVFS